MDDDSQPDRPGPPARPERQNLLGRKAVLDAARALLRGLPASGCREAWLVDADLADWPLGEAAVVDALTAWLRQPGRRLNLLALQFDGLARTQPRFAAWRTHFVHVIESRAAQDLDAGDMPSVLLLPPLCLQVQDREHWRAVRSADASDSTRLGEQIAAISQRSVPAWPVRDLGL